MSDLPNFSTWLQRQMDAAGLATATRSLASSPTSPRPDGDNVRAEALGDEFADEERWCGVDAAARLALMNYLKRERMKSAGPLFVQRQQRAMTANAITCVIRSLAESAGVECSAHDFRRACAARMLAAGAMPDVVQYQLGHKTAHLTMRYGHEARRDRSLEQYHALDQGVRPLRRAI